MTGVRLPEELENRLDNLVLKTHRSKSYYIKRAIEDYLNDQEDYLLAAAISERITRGIEKTYTLAELKNGFGLNESNS